MVSFLQKTNSSSKDEIKWKYKFNFFLTWKN